MQLKLRHLSHLQPLARDGVVCILAVARLQCVCCGWQDMQKWGHWPQGKSTKNIPAGLSFSMSYGKGILLDERSPPREYGDAFKPQDYVTYLAQDCEKAEAEFALSLLWAIRQATEAQLSAQKY